MTNRDRAQAVRDALSTFTERTYGGRTPEQLGAPTIAVGIAGERTPEDTDAQTMVGDFLCDLRHYCAAVGIDFDAMMDSGEYHYVSEHRYGWDEDTD